MKKDLIEKFKNGEVAINVETQQEWDEFMQWLEENTDLRWNTGHKPTEKNYWNVDKELTCVDSNMAWDAYNIYEGSGLKIIKYKDLKEKKGMKTSEFIKRVEELGYEVRSGEHKTSGYNYYPGAFNEEIFSIDETHINTINTDKGFKIKKDLFDLIVEYAKTPLEEREEPKRYVWKLEGVGSDFNSSRHYFNYIEDKNSWSLKDKNNGFMNRTIFTEKEFTQLKSKLGIELEFEKEEIK